MPKYKYKFCDGTVSEVEVSDEQYAMLKAMDEQEKDNNRRHGRQHTPIKSLLKNETDGAEDKGAKE
jgi:hypothetical protein